VFNSIRCYKSSVKCAIKQRSRYSAAFLEISAHPVLGEIDHECYHSLNHYKGINCSYLCQSESIHSPEPSQTRRNSRTVLHLPLPSTIVLASRMSYCMAINFTVGRTSQHCKYYAAKYILWSIYRFYIREVPSSIYGKMAGVPGRRIWWLPQSLEILGQ
jgi:hypothetical protein